MVPSDIWGAFPYEMIGGVYQPTTAYPLSHVVVTVICVFVPCFFMGVTFPLLCSAFRVDTIGSPRLCSRQARPAALPGTAQAPLTGASRNRLRCPPWGLAILE
jgi:hypothetical protein